MTVKASANSISRQVFFWFSSTKIPEIDAVRSRLLDTTFERRTFLYLGALSILVLAVTAAVISGKLWPYLWLSADLILVATRLMLIRACETAKAAGRTGPLGWLMFMGGVWTVVAGLGFYGCVVSGHTALAVLAGTNVAFIIGAISSRNAATPRYGTLAMITTSTPYIVGALMSPFPGMLVLGVQAPVHIAGMAILLWRNHESQVRLIRAELRSFNLAITDPLTGLPNRTFLRDCLQSLCNGIDAAEPQSGFALLSLDLDGFKHVNDRYGHVTGDSLLQRVAARLRRGARPTDHVCRLGGDEFIILMPGAGEAEASDIAGRLIERLSAPIKIDDAIVLRVGVSVGCAFAPTDGTTPEMLIAHADKALYEAKRGGRGRYVPYSKAG